MKIEDLFSRLSYGEFSNLSLTDEVGGIDKKHHPKILHAANEGLLKLYSRFILKERSLILHQYRHITNYHLRAEFATNSNSDKPFKYIRDLDGSPFLGDVIKILEVADNNRNYRPLNDKEDPRSVFTPTPDTLQIPRPVEGQSLGVVFQAKHVDLSPNLDIVNQEIDLPFFLEGALQSYIAFKVYDAMNGQDNKATAQGHLAAYEMSCLETESKDLVNNTFHTTHHKLESRGFI